MVVPAQGVDELGGWWLVDGLEHSHVSLGGHVAAQWDRLTDEQSLATTRSRFLPLDVAPGSQVVIQS